MIRLVALDSGDMAKVPLVISREPRLCEAASAAAAACGVPLKVVRDSSGVRALWREASVVVIGVDSAAMVVGLGLPQRQGVHLVGDDLAQLAVWSVPLDASVLSLAGEGGYLTALISGDEDALGGRARVLRVVGGSGGVGASTLAAALAQRAANRGLGVALVELDACGGGIDLMYGAERAPGWRWHDLAAASGHLGSLQGHLPNVSGVDLLAIGRASGERDGAGGSVPTLPGAEAVRAVVASLRRSHDLVVLDSGADPGGADRSQAQTLLLVAAEVRAVVAARSRAAFLGLQDASVLVRTGPGRRLDPLLVADTLGMPLVGVIGTDGGLPLALESGDPPGRGRGRYGRQVDALLQVVLGDE